MARHVFLLQIRPGCEAEYQRRHDNQWPELSDEMRTAGIEWMEIYRNGSQAILILEASDFAQASVYLATAPASVRWETYMSDVLESHSAADAWAHSVPRIFSWTGK